LPPSSPGRRGCDYRRFVLFNLLGGFLWAIGMTTLGYYLGRFFGTIEGVDRYFTLLVLAFFFIPGLPTLFHLWKDNRERIFAWLRRRFARSEPPAA
jgi:membrane-associated protein